MDLEHFVKIGLSTIGRSHRFYWGNCFFSDYLVLPDIFLFIQYYFVKIPVHDQLNPDVLRDMKNDETYVFDSEVCQECFSLGMAIVIFIVKQSNLIN